MLFAGLGTVVRIGAHLLIVPLMLVQFSTGEQAAWWVFVSLGAFANLADFGFGPVISRVYSYLWAGAEDFKAEGLQAVEGASREPNLDRIRIGRGLADAGWPCGLGGNGIVRARRL